MSLFTRIFHIPTTLCSEGKTQTAISAKDGAPTLFMKDESHRMKFHLIHERYEERSTHFIITLAGLR